MSTFLITNMSSHNTSPVIFLLPFYKKVICRVVWPSIIIYLVLAWYYILLWQPSRDSIYDITYIGYYNKLGYVFQIASNDPLMDCEINLGSQDCIKKREIEKNRCQRNKGKIVKTKYHFFVGFYVYSVKMY